MWLARAEGDSRDGIFGKSLRACAVRELPKVLSLLSLLSPRTSGDERMSVSIEISDAVLEQIAERAAEFLAERQAPATSPWLDADGAAEHWQPVASGSTTSWRSRA